MRILDRAIIFRFLANFALLFTLLFVFAASVDTILQLDKYLSAGALAVKDGRYGSRTVAVMALLAEYHGPRVFQFFQFMIGLLCVGAMGFTFAQMHRARELVAILAAGVPLRRCVWAVLAAALALNVLQIANQELVLPHFAERLVAGHDTIGRGEGAAFTVPLTRDSAGHLLYATKFDPERGEITGFLGLERDEQGGLRRRTTAPSARWDARESAWMLEEGVTLVREGDARSGADVQTRSEPAAGFRTDLSPKALTARHFRLFAQWLSSAELAEIAHAGAIDPALARRMQLGRWGSIAVNLLVLAIAVPFFLQRGPANMLRQSVLCAAVGVPAIIVSAILMAAPIEGLPPTVMVALPIAALIPVAAARIGWLPS